MSKQQIHKWNEIRKEEMYELEVSGGRLDAEYDDSPEFPLERNYDLSLTRRDNPTVGATFHPEKPDENIHIYPDTTGEDIRGFELLLEYRDLVDNSNLPEGFRGGLLALLDSLQEEVNSATEGSHRL